MSSLTRPCKKMYVCAAMFHERKFKRLCAGELQCSTGIIHAASRSKIVAQISKVNS